MQIRFLIILFGLLSFCLALRGDPSVSTPSLDSVNLITGQVPEPLPTLYQYEYYKQGTNNVDGTSIQLSKGDWRIGKVKLSKKVQASPKPVQPSNYFFYFKGYTEVRDPFNHKSIYRYSPNQLIECVEQYANTSTLYRKERFYWDQSFAVPKLISRYMEDASGHINTGYVLQYNKTGNLIKETIVGNLSGNSVQSLHIQSDGLPENGERYSSSYEYSLEDPTLLLKETEDNGANTSYFYHPKTKQCIAKLKGNQGGIVARCFYLYNEQGFITRTLLDDGCSADCDDLTAVTARQIIEVQFCQQGINEGQPLVTKNKYLDLASSKEILLEKVVCSYSDKGELIQKDFYDADESLRYSIHMSYDAQGNLSSTTDSRGEKAIESKEEFHYRYNDMNQCEAKIDLNGNETLYEYDPFNRVIKTTYPAVLDESDQSHHPSLMQEYDSNDNEIFSRNALGNTTETSYNSRRKVTKITHPDGTTNAYVYFLDGTIKETVDVQGNKTCYVRDCFGRTIQSQEYAYDGTLLNTLTYTYQGGLLKSVTDGKHFKMTHEYDGAGREIGTLHETKDGTKRNEWSYDASGQKISVKEYFGKESNDFVTKLEIKDAWQNTIQTQILDAQGNVQRTIENPKSSPIQSQKHVIKNDRGQHVNQEETVNAEGMRQLITYDALNRQESVITLNAFGDKITDKQFRYDDNGNVTLEKHLSLLKGKDSKTFTIKKTYDLANHLTSIQEEAGNQTKKTCYHYNSKGLLETITKPDGNLLSYTYDTAGHPIRFKASDDSFDYQYTYDDVGRLICIDDLILSQSIQRRYNAFNQIVEETFFDLFGIKNSYDLAGRRTALTLPDASKVLYHYQGSLLGIIERLNPKQEHLYQHSYQFQRNTGKLALSNLIGDMGSISYDYDSNGNLSEIKSPCWSETIPTEQVNKYLLLDQFTIQDPAGKVVQHFNYSSDHQLQSEQGSFNHQYEHDSLHNRISYDGQEWTINSLNQLIKSTDAEYQYDANGNLIAKKTQNSLIHYEYDGLNRLTHIIKDKGEAIGYSYDPFNRRLSQDTFHWDTEKEVWNQSQTHYFLYDGDKEIGKINEKGEITELRILGLGKGAEIGTAIALEFTDRIYAPIHDHQGSVRCLIDIKNKCVSEFYRYSAYGLEEIYDGTGDRLEQTSLGNPWRYSSKRKDSFSDLIFFGMRYYDPTMGRWITPDPLFFHDSANLYAFVKNNPVTNYDLYGLFSISSIWDTVVQSIYQGWMYLQRSAINMPNLIMAEFQISKDTQTSFERVGKKFIGETMIRLLGYHPKIFSEQGSYGKGEFNEKVRVTFINGILTNRNLITENIDLISKSHGGYNVHYIFRATEGYAWDIAKAAMIRMGFQFGFRSEETYLLADMWKKLIQDMGGVGAGGVIIHYAHSLGGSDTDRARSLLTPEEQKMIRVISFGSSTFIRNEGFQSVINYASIHDGVSYTDPLGMYRNWGCKNSNVVWLSRFFAWPCFPLDHILSWKTYRSVLSDYGERFLIEFSPQ